MMPLFHWDTDEYTLHSGGKTPFLIDCTALRKADWEALARYAVEILCIEFSDVVGIPRSGLKFAEALRPYRTEGPLLIADDVLTTGYSMEEYRQSYVLQECIGVVVFARGDCPEWVQPIFELPEPVGALE